MVCFICPMSGFFKIAGQADARVNLHGGVKATLEREWADGSSPRQQMHTIGVDNLLPVAQERHDIVPGKRANANVYSPNLIGKSHFRCESSLSNSI